MTHFSHEVETRRPIQLALIVLQSDETIEPDFRRLLPSDVEMLVTRVPSGEDVTPETLHEMEHHLAGAAALLPRGGDFKAVGYACTSGASHIGADRAAHLVRQEIGTSEVTDPLTALIRACGFLGLQRLALLSPYIPSVSDRVRERLVGSGLDVPAFGSFDVAQEARVVRISEASIIEAAIALCEQDTVDALFLSCTNLRTLGVIDHLEARLDIPVLSSNLVLAWDMLSRSGLRGAEFAPGLLFRSDRGSAPDPGIFRGQ